MVDKPADNIIHDAGVKVPRRRRRNPLKHGAELVGSGASAVGNAAVGAVQGIIGVIMLLFVADAFKGDTAKLFGNMFKGFGKRVGLNIKDGANDLAQKVIDNVPGAKTATEATKAGLQKAGQALEAGSDATGAERVGPAVAGAAGSALQGIQKIYRNGLEWDKKTATWINPSMPTSTSQANNPVGTASPGTPSNPQTARQQLRRQSNPKAPPKSPGDDNQAGGAAPTITKVTPVIQPVVTPYSSTGSTPTASGP